MAGALLVLSEREAKGGAGNAMPGELCGSLSRGQQCQDCHGAWTRSQATGDGWRHAAGNLLRGRARGAARRGQAHGGRPGAALGWAEARRSEVRAG